MAASAGAARPLAGLWSEQASVAGMGWEEPGAEAVEVVLPLNQARRAHELSQRRENLINRR